MDLSLAEMEDSKSSAVAMPRIEVGRQLSISPG